MSFLLNQLLLALWNFINSRIDAYRILKNKTIAHGVNFVAYGLFVALLCWLGEYDFKTIILFSVSAFFNRQVVFDPLLNKRRGLSIFYQSVANPPKSLMDRIERFIWPSNNGEMIFYVYLILYAIIMALNYII